MTEATNSLSRNPLADNCRSTSFEQSNTSQPTTRKHTANSILTDTPPPTDNRTRPTRLRNEVGTPVMRAGFLRPTPHPRGSKTGAQGAQHGRHRGSQSLPRHPHVVLQARRGRLI